MSTFNVTNILQSNPFFPFNAAKNALSPGRLIEEYYTLPDFAENGVDLSESSSFYIINIYLMPPCYAMLTCTSCLQEHIETGKENK